MYDSVLILLLSYGHHDLFNQVFCILNNISFDTLTHYNVYKCYRILTGQSSPYNFGGTWPILGVKTLYKIGHVPPKWAC
jgi:hypothetical protein